MGFRIKNGFFEFLLLVIFLVVSSLMLFFYNRVSQQKDAAKNATSAKDHPSYNFSFSAAGDFDNDAEAEAVIGKIGETKTDFTLGLGDLAYAKGQEEAWCNMVKAHTGENYPFELVAGNHDDGRDGDIKNYVACLPNKLENSIGEYGIEYYFDYKGYARFIQISPDIDNYGYQYKEGSEHLTWLKNAIDTAREQDVKWVIVSMHKNCITPGEKECEIGSDLMNMLIEKKVDLVLQGHEHSYFRSKQLALNKSDCPTIVVNEYNQHCVVDSDNQLQKGQGTIIVISGAGGRKLREMPPNDPETEYFNTFNAKNHGDTYGFSLFRFAEDELQASFVPVLGSFEDRFSIR